MSPHDAAAQHSSPRARVSVAVGTVFGGVTTQDFPVVITTSNSGRKVTGADIAIGLTCTSGSKFATPDHYRGLPVSKRRRFHAAFGPQTVHNPDGTTSDFQGSIKGAFDKARTKASGKWTLTETDRDAAGAVTDTCTGSVRWTAQQ